MINHLIFMSTRLLQDYFYTAQDLMHSQVFEENFCPSFLNICQPRVYFGPQIQQGPQFIILSLHSCWAQICQNALNFASLLRRESKPDILTNTGATWVGREIIITFVIFCWSQHLLGLRLKWTMQVAKLSFSIFWL